MGIQHNFSFLMDPKTHASPLATSETSVAKINRLETNFNTGKGLMMISRSSLVHELEMAYAKYMEAFKQENKKEALRWDGAIRALHIVLDMEIPQ